MDYRIYVVGLEVVRIVDTMVTVRMVVSAAGTPIRLDIKNAY